MLSRGLFWQISEDNNADKTSVLFGTIHLPLCSDKVMLRVNHFIEQFDYIYTETTLDPEVQRLVLHHINVDPLEWKNWFSDRQLVKLSKLLLKTYRIEFEMVKHLRPMFIMTLIYSSLTQSESDLKLDQYIWQRAQAFGKNTDGIESIHRQVEILKAIPLEYEFRQFKRWAGNISKMNIHFKRLMDLYIEESILMLYNYSKSSMTGVKSLMLDDRNVSMADTILNQHRRSSGFFTFGAGHLAGPNGVLRLLKNKGLSVRPMVYS